MTDAAPDGAGPAAGWGELLASSGMASAFALTAIGALFGAHVLVSTMGAVGYSAVIVGLCVIGIAMLIARRDELTLLRLMPTTLIVFMAWLLLTVAWSTAPGLSIVGWLALLAPAILAIVVAHTRDTLQTVRAVGDVLRVLLVGSLAIEVLSGILLDLPIAFLKVAGNLAEGGPIQGLFGTRTRLGLVTVIALITFLVEWRTKSVRPGVAVFSVVLAGALALLTGSPIVLVLAFITGLATAILALVRRTPAALRPRVQIALAVVVAIGVLVGYLVRRPLVYWLNAAPDFFTRSQVWNAVLDMVERRPVVGWGWFGTWSPRSQPFLQIRFETGHEHSSALNAYMDVLLQAGWVGAFLFVAFCAVAVARAWLTASERRSTVYTWPALILIALLANSVVDSTALSGFGWFLLVLCATQTANVRGWRAAIDAGSEEPRLPPQARATGPEDLRAP